MFDKKVFFCLKIILISVLFLLFGLTSLSFSAESRPNIILISIETTRADHLSCYGYKRKTTPTIDKLAEEGILFENMFAPRGQTWPSLTSMMTSLYPANHGVRDNGYMLSPSIISLAEILKDNGYTGGAFLARTASAAKWRGFDHKEKGRGEGITQAAINWVKANSDKKIFLWVHYFEPHYPYRPPAPYDSVFDRHYKGEMDGRKAQTDKITLNKIKLNEADLNHIISLYDGCILFIDDQIKQLLTTLKGLGIEENSIIIITADHGDDLYQHHFYFYHDGSIYDSTLHVPLVIRLPNKDPKNMRVKEIVENIDIAPTILKLVNIPIPDQFEGNSMTPLIFSRNNTDKFLSAYSEIVNKIISIRTDKYRYIFNPKGDHIRVIKDNYSIRFAREELYDITNDPDEQNNIIVANPDVAKKLKDELLKWPNFKAWLKYDEKKDKEMSEGVRERLKALGYIQ